MYVRIVIEKYRDYPLVSGGLVLINVVVFLLSYVIGDRLFAMGRLSVQETVFNREYGRLIWAMFLHNDLNHIFNNMIILFFLGAMIEKEIGHMPYGLVYFLSGIGGNVLSLAVKIVSNDWSASIGASGAVFGLDGALLAMVFFSGRKLPSVTPTRTILMILLSLYNGFMANNIDNAAHVGGLVIGFATAVILCMIRRKMRTQIT